MESRLIDAEQLLAVVYSESKETIARKLTHEYSRRQPDGTYLSESRPMGDRSIQRWRSLSEIPNQENLEKLCKAVAGMKEVLEVLDSSEVLLHVNLSKDSFISSNGKKVFNLLMLSSGDAMPCSAKYGDIYEYFRSLCVKPLVSYAGDEVKKTFKYLPCRSITVPMLVTAGKKYGYTGNGINSGLENLIENDLVTKHHFGSTDLYKLNFSGIKAFVSAKP
ncbi:MAG: hypothetical protein IK020_03640 [Clostridiales bacterium]|nr:hypothetical protein [Clostridiales bacterium]